jgi:four helix bundle protein
MHINERKTMAQFQKLRVWDMANEIVAMTCSHLRSIRGESELRDQMKRAAISIASNIAEGSARRTKADRRNFFVIARASAAELNAQYHIVRACGFLTISASDTMLDRVDHCGRMLSNLIKYLDRG